MSHTTRKAEFDRKHTYREPVEYVPPVYLTDLKEPARQRSDDPTDPSVPVYQNDSHAGERE